MSRPWTRLASAALAGHVFFELVAGVGMPGASLAGPAPAAAAWAPRVARLLPLLLVPALVSLQHAEHRRLVEQARRQPGWWNRRLQGRPGR